MVFPYDPSLNWVGCPEPREGRTNGREFMSWVTVVWSMIASACLTLAAIYCLVWYRNRTAWAHLWFAATAVCTAGLAFFELRLMQAETLGDVLAARMWAHVPLFFWLVSITWFVRTYLGAGRLWLAWTICGLRAISLLVNLLLGQNPAFGNVASLQHVQFLGERVTVLGAAPNSMTPITQFTTLLVVIFVADASVTAWRRGDRRRALMVGANLEFFLVLPDGATRWISSSGRVERGATGQPLLIRGASRDITANKRAELAVRNLSGRLLSAQEEERRRIARELHDNVSQQMAAVTIRIGQIGQRLDQPPTVVASSMRELAQLAGGISTEIHNLSHRLHSSKLEMLGLVDALRGHCHEVLAQGVQVHFHHENVPDAIPSDVALCLFRIAQEGLNNIVKHSGAQQAHVTLRATGEALVLSVEDSGRGFDEAGGGGQRGLGLASMRERLRLLGGEFTVRARAGSGTTITAGVPIFEVPGTDRGANSESVA